ncbi:MAG: hypothetical protein ACO1OG_04975 [Devosia sp.]
MRSGLTGQRALFLALGLVLAAGLSACTTVEGTNALTDIGTFEREVAIESMKGMGMIGREQKSEDIPTRGPLVMPKTASLPPPQAASTATAQLPANSTEVQFNTAGLSEAEIARLRKVRVLDSFTPGGRPLTQAELQQLTAKFQGNLQMKDRPLYLPPAEYYYTTVKGQDMVCLAANGDLVPLNDPACPPELKKALAAQG